MLAIQNQPRFIPATPDEVQDLGWKELDIVLITGDAHVETPHIGAAVIGRVLLDAGWRVGMIAQPDTGNGTDITRLGEPRLFWGVTSGCVDSMISNYTATGKRRRRDDLTPGGVNNRRPDRAVIVYSNLIRRYFKQTRPIVLGGIEASLRRISHYDAWSDSIRRSILFDAKADILAYGMAEKTVVEIAEKLDRKESVHAIRGLCYISPNCPDTEALFGDSPVVLPEHKRVTRHKADFARMFEIFYENTDPVTAKPLCQQQDTRYLVQNPPQHPPTVKEIDRIYELPFARDLHPACKTRGVVAALETIRFSLTTHRGCYGECRFCAITVHQGRRVISRSERSILREASTFTSHPDFKGIISNVGGPTANMYGIDCTRKSKKGACRNRSCLFPNPCEKLPIDHRRQIALLESLRWLQGVRKVFVGSGIRHDLLTADRKSGKPYLESVLRNHVSGQMKIAPEHVVAHLLDLMGKPAFDRLKDFLDMFESVNRRLSRRSYLTYYMIAAHPGCTIDDMHVLKKFCIETLKHLPEQVQIFTPSPATYSTLMYFTECDPFSGKTLFVEKNARAKEKQKAAMRIRGRNSKGGSRRPGTN